ncbi:Hypothetical predicted protein [Cloeon dipterum]|uniref:Uncharacterized protein n=1 Tax=Cloeon dipterum TaxID=197152 RepID=A0A8S1CYV4_9INSE|nr:Hypothetical predicted protein [Cloeon dipterum]
MLQFTRIEDIELSSKIITRFLRIYARNLTQLSISSDIRLPCPLMLIYNEDVTQCPNLVQLNLTDQTLRIQRT